MRCALYLRVSSAQQGAGHAGKKKDTFERERYGLPRQDTECREYAEEKGWTILEEHVYQEVYTGARVRGRPELARLREAAKEKPFDVILVHELSRISRNQNEIGWMFAEMENLGIRWESVTEDIDDTPFGKLVRSMAAAFAEIEREKMIERVAGGRRERVRSGKYPAVSRCKYGYDFDDPKTKARLVANPKTAPIVRDIFHLYVNEGMTSMAIAKYLMERQVPTRAGGDVWYAQAISKMLRDEAYKGVGYANMSRVEREPGGVSTIKPNPREEWTRLADGIIEPLVSEELWDAAQAKMAQSKKSSWRSNKAPFETLLRGVVKCGYCGRGMWAIHHTETNKPAYRHNTETARVHNCPSLTIQAHIIDTEVWNVIEQLVRNPALIEQQTKYLETTDPTAGRLEQIIDELSAAEEQHKRAVTNVLFFEGNEEAHAIAMGAMNSIKEKLAWLREERDRLERDRKAWESSKAVMADISALVERVNARLDTMSEAMKQKVIQAFGVEVHVYTAQTKPRWRMWVRLASDQLQEIVDWESTIDCVVDDRRTSPRVHNYILLYFDSTGQVAPQAAA